MSHKILFDWWPVYLEPIVDSGEKICIGICYKKDFSPVFFKLLLNNKIAGAVYREKAFSIGKLASYSCEMACEYIERKFHDIESLSSDGLEISVGLYLGSGRVVEGYDFEEIHSRVTKKVSFFSFLDFYDETGFGKTRTESLVDLVEKDFIEKGSFLAKNFNKTIKVANSLKDYHFADSRGGLVAEFFKFQKGAKIYKAEISSLNLSMTKPAYKKQALIALMDKKYDIKKRRLQGVKEVEGVARHLDIHLEIVEKRSDMVRFIEKHAA